MSFELFHTIQGLILAAGGTLMVLIALVIWRLKPRTTGWRDNHFGGGRPGGARRAVRPGRPLSRRARQSAGGADRRRRGRKRIAGSPATLLAVLVSASAVLSAGRSVCAPTLDGRAKKCARFLGHRMIQRIGLDPLEDGRLEWSGRLRAQAGS